MRRSLGSTLVAAALAVVFALSYAGPVVCASVHAHASAEGPAERGHDDCGGGTAPGAQVNAGTDASSCADALHCGPSVIARLPQAAAGFDPLPFDEVSGLAPFSIAGALIRPTTPPPKA